MRLILNSWRLSEQCDNHTFKDCRKVIYSSVSSQVIDVRIHIYSQIVTARDENCKVWMFSHNVSSYLIIRPHTPSSLPFARDARGRNFGSIVQKPGGFCLPSWSWIMCVMRSARRSHLSAALFQWFMIRSYLVAADNKRRDSIRAYMKQPVLYCIYIGPDPFDFIYSIFISKMDSYISK